jgi:hypothetical protein
MKRMKGTAMKRIKILLLGTVLCATQGMTTDLNLTEEKFSTKKLTLTDLSWTDQKVLTPDELKKLSPDTLIAIANKEGVSNRSTHNDRI